MNNDDFTVAERMASQLSNLQQVLLGRQCGKQIQLSLN